MAEDLELQQRRLKLKKVLTEVAAMRGMGTELVSVIIPVSYTHLTLPTIYSV